MRKYIYMFIAFLGILFYFVFDSSYYLFVFGVGVGLLLSQAIETYFFLKDSFSFQKALSEVFSHED